MKSAIANSPDLLQFCLSVSPDQQRDGRAAGHSHLRRRHPGEATVQPYLGNNGFYQGIQGEPAISQRPQPTDVCGNNGQPACTFAGANNGNPGGSLTTLNFTGIQVTERQRPTRDQLDAGREATPSRRTAASGTCTRTRRRPVPSPGRSCPTAQRRCSAIPATTRRTQPTPTPASSSTPARSPPPMPPWAIPPLEQGSQQTTRHSLFPRRRTRNTRPMPRRSGARPTPSWTRPAPSMLTAP